MKELNLLGYKVRELVTGFSGVVTSISFDLYGCVQALVTPEKTKEEKLGESYWFDAKRLKVESTEPVMEVPNFASVPGGNELPGFSYKPVI